MCVLPESYPTVGNEEFVCVCVLIWKEACSYRNSLLGFWRWANIQPIKMKPSGGRWFNVSSNPVSMQFLKNMLQKSNSFWLRLTVSKKNHQHSLTPTLCEQLCWWFSIVYFNVAHLLLARDLRKGADSSHMNTQFSYLGAAECEESFLERRIRDKTCWQSSSFTRVKTKAIKIQRLDYKSSNNTIKMTWWTVICADAQKSDHIKANRETGNIFSLNLGVLFCLSFHDKLCRKKAIQYIILWTFLCSANWQNEVCTHVSKWHLWPEIEEWKG